MFSLVSADPCIDESISVQACQICDTCFPSTPMRVASTTSPSPLSCNMTAIVTETTAVPSPLETDTPSLSNQATIIASVVTALVTALVMVSLFFVLLLFICKCRPHSNAESARPRMMVPTVQNDIPTPRRHINANPAYGRGVTTLGAGIMLREMEIASVREARESDGIYEYIDNNDINSVVAIHGSVRQSSEKSPRSAGGELVDSYIDMNAGVYMEVEGK